MDLQKLRNPLTGETHPIPTGTAEISQVDVVHLILHMSFQ